jgi:hypothetical protein
MYLLHTLLFSAALVSAAPQVLNKPRAVLDTTLSRMSDADVFSIYHKCWNGKLTWPQNDLPTPVKEQDSKQLNVYKVPATKPHTLIVHNYCNYDIHYLHLNGATTLGAGVLKSGATAESSLSGTVWKASKTASLEKVTLVEYNVAADGKLWYNLSLIECLGITNGLKIKDASACAGLDGGLQLGNKDNFSFQCKPGTWCDDQAYFYYVSRDSMFIGCKIGVLTIRCRKTCASL